MKTHTYFKVLKKSTLLVMVFLLAVNLSKAQKPETEINRFVRDFAQAYQNLPKSRDEETVLKYVSKDLKSTILKSNVMADYGLIHSNYDDFNYHLSQMIDTEGMSVEYNIKNIFKSQVQGDLGVVVCEIAVEVSSRGVIWNKGTEMTTFVLKKNSDGWKIFHFFIVSFEGKQTKGICLLEVFESSIGDFVIKTIVPKGDEYLTKLNTIDFNKGNNRLLIKVNNEITYSWDEQGTIDRLNNEDSSVKVIGKTNDKKDAALLIITKDIYAGNCTEFKVKH